MSQRLSLGRALPAATPRACCRSGGVAGASPGRATLSGCSRVRRQCQRGPGRDLDRLSGAVTGSSGASPTSAVAASGASLAATGEAALAAGDRTVAERSFDRALLRDPTNVTVLIGRAEARLGQAQLAGARADLDASLELVPNGSAEFRRRAALRMRFGDAVGAEEDYARALAIDPGDAEATAGRGEALVARAAGDQQLYDRAMADFTRAVALDPDLAEARLGPALVLADRASLVAIRWTGSGRPTSYAPLAVLESDPRLAALEPGSGLALLNQPGSPRLRRHLTATGQRARRGAPACRRGGDRARGGRLGRGGAAASDAIGADPLTGRGGEP